MEHMVFFCQGASAITELSSKAFCFNFKVLPFLCEQGQAKSAFEHVHFQTILGLRAPIA